MPSGNFVMMNKRKRDDTGERRGAGAKRQRIRKRSRSEPLRNDSVTAEKREALKRLFGRICSVEMDDNQQRGSDEEEELAYELLREQNDDPLLDSVPVDMDPEQLGFLVCAQETLRFLHGRGISFEHPVFARLRLRLLQGIGEIGVA